MNLQTEYRQSPLTTTTSFNNYKERPQSPVSVTSRNSLFSIMADQCANNTKSLYRSLQAEEVIPPAPGQSSSRSPPTWTYAQQQVLVSHELSRRRHSLQFDDNAFRNVKAELKKSGAVTGLGALQLLDQKVIASLSERREQERNAIQKKTTGTKKKKSSINLEIRRIPINNNAKSAKTEHM